MDISTLKQTIENALKTQPCTVSGAALSSAAITTLLTDIVGKDEFVLSGATKISEDATSITVQGAMTQAVQGIANLQATAVFTVVGGMAQISVVLTGLPKGWKPSDSFASLKNSLFDKFSYTNPQLLLNSQNIPALPQAFPANLGYPAYPAEAEKRIVQGLGVQATLALQSEIEGLSWLLNASSWSVQGPIALLDGEPLIVLSSQPGTGLSIVGFDIAFSLQLASVLVLPSDAPAKPVMTSVVQLEADITKDIGAAQPLDIPVYTRVYSAQDNVLVVGSDLAEASSLLFDQIAKLIDNADISGQVPSQFPVLDNIQLTTVQLLLDTKQKKALSASATIEFQDKNKTWSVFNGLLQFQSMSVMFTLVDPGGMNAVETDVTATAIVADGTLTAAVALPDLSFSCQLVEGTSINISKIVNDIVGNSITMPTIECTEFAVLGDVSEGMYRFQATVETDWTFSIGSKPFGLSSISLDLSHTTGTQPTTSGELVGTFTVAGAQLFASASYDSTQAGWTFEGGTLGEQNISITALLSDLVSLFGASFPANAPQVNLKNLNITFNTASHDFTFLCSADITIADVEFMLGIDVGITAEEKTFTGYLWLGESEFEIDFLSSDQQTSITAKWNNQGEPLGVADIAKALGMTPPDIPSELDLALLSASFTYDFTNKTFVLTASSKNYGKAMFVALQIQGKWQFAFALAIDRSISLSDLPLVGKELAKIETVLVDNFQVIVSSAAIDATTAQRINALVQAAGTGAPVLPTDGVGSGVNLSIVLQFGNDNVPLSINIGGSSSNSMTGSNTSTAAVMLASQAATGDAAGQKIKWFDIQKTFGPVSFQKIGVSYQDGIVWFFLDGSLTIAGLTLSLVGMGFGSPLTSFDPHFTLEGIGVDYQSGPITIGGGFLNVPVTPPVEFEFAGGAIIKTANFNLAAVGAYAQVSGQPSMFVFAQYFAPIGGPPYFFITGLMGGFGYNSSLRIPGQDEVASFPFVKGIGQPDTVGGKGATPLDVLAKISGPGGWVSPRVGQYWLAFGLQATSFEIISTTALLIAEFGQEFQLALIGLSTMRLPQAGPVVYAYIEMQLEAVFKPQEGFFGLSALLTSNSYVLDPACHLTGGFAFYMWFEGSDHPGDFVVTAGGYHPAFSPPPWYPKEPRLGFNWALDGSVSVSGGAYFALTPSSVMAGGSLEVLFHDGNLRAWFTAHADVFIQWKPFHFTASIGVSIGVSYHIKIWFVSVTLKVEIGAGLSLWGPRTGGKVYIDWYIISFTIRFGASESSNSGPLLWPEFQALLPAPTDVSKIVANSGLIDEDRDFANNVSRWVVRPAALRFSVQTAVPTTQLFISSAGTTPYAKGSKIDIRPMVRTGIAVAYRVYLTLLDTGSEIDFVKDGWTLDAVTGNVPAALWGVPTDKPLSSDALITDQLVGLSAAAPLPVLGASPGPIDIAANLSYDPLPVQGITPVQSGLPPSGDKPIAGQNVVKMIADGIMTSPAKDNRNALFAALQEIGVDPGTNGSLATFAQQAGMLFDAEPLVVNPVA